MAKSIKFLCIAVVLTAFISCDDDSSDITFNVTNTTNNNGGGVEGTPSGVAVVEIGGDQTEDVILDGPGMSEEYLLTTPLNMLDGTTLTITAGTIIRSSAGTNGFIAIQQGAQIDAQGTAENPIVMTSNASLPQAGDWGGLVLLGRATINSGATATSEVGNFTYGGTDDMDNTGTLRYVVLSFTGAAINSESEFNGISFYAIGSATTVEFIQVNEGADDGVEFFGGTVNGNNIAITEAEDDSVDWTEGWRGTLTDVYVATNFLSDKAIEADGNEDNNAATPLSSPTLINFTAIGIGSDIGREAFRIRRGTEVNFTNVFVQGFAEGYDIDDALTVDAILNDNSNVVDITFDDVITNFTSDSGTDGTTPTEADFISGIGNGTQTDVETWGAGWTVGIL